MKIICIIPIFNQGNNKAMYFFDKKPLAMKTIDSAIASKVFTEIIVVTNDRKYEKLIKSQYEKLSFVRIDDMKNYMDIVLLDFEENIIINELDIYTPFRDFKDIFNANKLFQKYYETDNDISLLTVHEESEKFDIVTTENGQIENIIEKRKNVKVVNNSIKIIDSNNLKRNKSFVMNKMFYYELSRKHSLYINDQIDFVSAIGNNYFNYIKREEENFERYNNEINKLLKSRAEKLLIGDSRMLNIELEGFTNISQGGITAKTVYEVLKGSENIFDFERTKEIIISLGVNDIGVSRGVNDIFMYIKKISELFINAKVNVVLVFGTLYRHNIENEEIDKLNKILSDNFLNIISLNDYLNEENHLKADKTYDGLHLHRGVDSKINKILNRYMNI